MKNEEVPKQAAYRSVQVLSETVARKIAAGEMIDRPCSVVHELLDNAIDAGASEISLAIQGGGIEEIRVSDNGWGMSRRDLELSWLAHATSKILEADDLDQVKTLGFRGEALSSLATCSRLEIFSSRAGEGYHLVVHGGEMLELSPSRARPGSTVFVADLFYNMPARRRFLKTTRTETGLCRKIFLEKAAAHPEIIFRFFSDSILKIFLPSSTPLARILAAWPRLAPPSAWMEAQNKEDFLSSTLVLAQPEQARRDRQYIQIYVNRRRINEFGLVQAITHAYDAWMPGGNFPMAFVFIDIDPSLVDFNIHPAKKEVRFRDLPAVHHYLVETIKNVLIQQTYRQRSRYQIEVPQQGKLKISQGQEIELQGYQETPLSPSNDSQFSRESPPIFLASQRGKQANRGKSTRKNSPRNPPPSGQMETWIQTLAQKRSKESDDQPKQALDSGTERPFHYIGQVMGVFLVVESEGVLYIVDQHAAHERVLYEELARAKKESEQLLIPHPLNLEPQALMRLELRRERLAELGVKIGKVPSEKKSDKAQWALIALPSAARGLEAELVDFLEKGAGDAQGFEKKLWADLACKAAIKDKDSLDAESARHLLRKTFALEIPRCPHGRPLWFELSRKELFDLVGRTG